MAARIVAPPTVELPDLRFVDPAPSRGTGARLWLVRHAEVHVDWQQRAYGNTEVPLSPEGEAATRAMGAAFASRALEGVWSSDLARALAMGRSIAEHTQAPLTTDARLREVWRGEWQGLPATEFRARWEKDVARFLANPWTWKGHGGESDADVEARAWPVLSAALAASRGGELVLAAHYNVIRVLVTRALGLTARASFAFTNAPAHVTLLVDERAGWRLAARDLELPTDI